VLALYRPGPMGMDSHTNYALRKTGQQAVTPIHAELEDPLKDILGPTYGLIVYQEQVQRAAQILAGYTLGEADLLRRAMGKKKKEILDKEYVPFQKGMRDRGYSDEAIQTVWDVLVPFAGYAFNKAHSAAYGLITYWTAWLKAHYPAEYMAALLTTNSDDKDKTAVFLNECRHMGIKVLSPDVNESIGHYQAIGEDIRVGLMAIRGVGQGVVEAVVRGRAVKGRYENFSDYLSKVDPAACMKKPTDALIKAGAFDSLGHVRRALWTIHEDAVDQHTSTKKAEAVGQDDLFGGLAMEMLGGASVQVPDMEEWDKRTLLAFEREMLGLYVSDHPLNGIADALGAYSDTSIVSLLDPDARRPEGTIVNIAGIVTTLNRKTTKAGDAMAIIGLEDLDGGIEVVVFPRTYQEFSALLQPDAILVVNGKIGYNDDGSMKVLAQSLSAPLIAEDGTRPVVVSLPATRVTTKSVESLMEILSAHKGSSTVHVRLVGADSTVTLSLSEAYRVQASGALTADLKQMFGAGVVG